MEQKNEYPDLEKTKQFIKEISNLMKEFDLAEIEIEENGRRFFLKRAMSVLSSIISPIGQPQTKIGGSDEKLETIKSPFPGTFYRRIGPDSEPYVEIGSKVEPKTTVCIIEAMKVINQINAETTGTIVKICLEDGQGVEYGTPLFEVKPK